MLGQDLVPYLQAKGYPVVGLTRSQLNVLDSIESLRDTLEAIQPDLIIHCAAFTDVDGAERDPEMAMAVNKDGTQKLALLCHELGIIFALISTDYVFDGTKGSPYTPADRTRPIGVYGHSKYYGELMVTELLETYYIIRTSWLYGLHKRNFVSFVIEAAKQGRSVSIVRDQIGSPTWTGSLCGMIEQVVTSGAYGIYHACDAGAVSRYDQAKVICEAAGLSTDHIRPTTSAAFAAPAKRPVYSVMDSSPLLATPWRTALQAYLELYLNAARC